MVLLNGSMQSVPRRRVATESQRMNMNESPLKGQVIAPAAVGIAMLIALTLQR
jgi:hypothetical protein